MVDYAIILQPDKTMETAILDILKPLDVDNCNINHTGYPPIRFSPIIANIKVNEPDSGKHAALVQLAVWVAAQFNRLSRLGGGVTLQMMPLVWVEDHDWRIYFAYRTEKKEIVSIYYV